MTNRRGVSHDTIFQVLYFQTRGGLKRSIKDAPRSGRTAASSRGTRRTHHSYAGPVDQHSERPADVEDRAALAHWEGD